MENKEYPLSLVDERYYTPINETESRVWGKCVITGQDWECVVPTDGLRRFILGEHMQKAMPQVNSDSREFIISGISPMGWTKLFPEGEE